MTNRNSFFEQFKKQMLEKGVDLEQTDNKSEKKSTLLQALENQLQEQKRGSLDHESFSRFTRHSSDSSTKEKTAEEESPRESNFTI